MMSSSRLVTVAMKMMYFALTLEVTVSMAMVLLLHTW